MAASGQNMVIARFLHEPDYFYAEETNQDSENTEEDKSAQLPEDAVEYNGHSYKVYYESVYWTEAKEACEALGGHLVTITSQEEQDFIESITDENLWIGAYRTSAEESEWQWVTGEDWEYENWGDGEPNNSDNVVANENCVVIFPEEWNDLANSNTYEQVGYICEWE